ncbi:MAG: PIN domain-containing protein [Clostridium sp.]|uniref:PIN domain-containing protein n=1 Tax=Clostridium sp. TaxID=1506 RepID=UPI0025C3A6F8|nr:PIN domain-containing protein [Clostridium sp.]MCE5221791.1 PIN domain-containing protein [Clostridium sp.]
MKRLFIVDTENTNNYSFISENKLTKSDSIVLFISNKMKGIKDDGCLELFSTKAKILIEKVEVGEKNSLDFQIVVYVSERTFRGRYDEVYIVSNDCGYKQAINYLNSKFNKTINIINYNKVSENIEVVSEIAVSQVNENIGELIKESIPKIERKDITKIINIKNESSTINDFHNRMRNSFGNELGREMYLKLKSNIKNLF